MTRVCGFEFDIESNRLIWLRQTHNIFEEDEEAPPSSTRLGDFLSPTDHVRAMAQLRKTMETGEPTEDEFDAITSKGNPIRIHILREVHPDDRAAVASEWERSVTTGESFNVTQRLRRHDGEWRWMSVLAVPVLDQDGLIQEWFGMHIDVTERRKLELELEAALAAANAANDAKSTFIANMSHEIRTPISTVVGMLEMLLRTPLCAEQRDHAATALNSSRDLLHVLNDVLDASAIDAGRVSIHSQPFRVRELLAEKLAMFELRAGQKGLTLTATVAANVPELQLADARRIRQVISNLIGNALKYTEKGSVEITTSFEADRDALRIEVTDTGIGIDEDAQRDLFKPFTQADSTRSRKYEGSGLGLSISRKLVELLGGTIGVSSQPAEGSTFWFEIPAPACEAPVGGRSGDQADAADPPLHILVAEDNPAAQRIAHAVLTAMGHTVTIVDNGAPAVAEVASGRYDVVLMDVMMPRMDGPTATRKIRELGGRAGGIPIIALTADVLFGKDGHHLMAGMTDYLSKPIDAALLSAALQRASLYAYPDST
jgi:signal transduction histidine kinase/CheY-like chemotaxis protein